MGDEAKAHVERCRMPWAAERLTECGRPVDDVQAVISHNELAAKWRREGQRRAAYTTCMTCLDRARCARPWDEDPAAILRREYSDPPTDDETGRRELLALGMLVEAHRDEYDQLRQGLADAVSLAGHRQAKRTARRSVR